MRAERAGAAERAGSAEPVVSVTAATVAAVSPTPADSMTRRRVRRARSRRRAAANPSSRSIPGGMSSVAAASRRRASASVSFKVVLPENLSQRLQTAASVRLDRSERAPEQVRDLSFREVGAIPQHQDLALPPRQRLERLAHLCTERLSIREIRDHGLGQLAGWRLATPPGAPP